MPAAASSFDDVAGAAGSGASPFVLAVGADLDTLNALTAWLQSAVPTFGRRSTEGVEARSLPSRLESGTGIHGTVFVVNDAGSGDEAELERRWRNWNELRERFLEALDYGRNGSVVFALTERAMSIVSAVSSQLLAVATVLVVAETPFGETHDPIVQAACETALRELEERYQMSTDDLLARVIAREDIPVVPHDLARWQAAARVVRPARS